METETLVCAVGNHEWQRERVRGRKPFVCPEHLSAPKQRTRKVAVTSAVAPVDGSVATEVKTEPKRRKTSSMDDTQICTLCGKTLPEELRRPELGAVHDECWRKFARDLG